MNGNIQILWADDEIELLKPQILFLESKGYSITAVTNGFDAIEKIKENSFEAIFLDEQMPGMSGLEALASIKEIKPHIPVVLITKSEEENLMDDAIGRKISDYLIKPVNPKQIFLTLKKLLDNQRLVSEKSSMDYQKAFRQLSMQLMDVDDMEGWKELYQKLVFWELELESNEDVNIADIIKQQKRDANNEFSKFVKKNYEDILAESFDGSSIMSHNLMEKKVFPQLESNKPLFFILIDNLRLDQWRLIKPYLNKYLQLEEEDIFCSILPI